MSSTSRMSSNSSASRSRSTIPVHRSSIPNRSQPDNVKVDDAIVTTMHTAESSMFSGSPWRSTTTLLIVPCRSAIPRARPRVPVFSSRWRSACNALLSLLGRRGVRPVVVRDSWLEETFLGTLARIARVHSTSIAVLVTTLSFSRCDVSPSSGCS